jgi:hypothetical protein
VPTKYRVCAHCVSGDGCSLGREDIGAEIGATNARLRLGQPLVLDASPSKEPCFSAPIEASPAISRSSGGLKKFFRIIQHNPKESIDGRE